jgi:hypothetical protein
MLRAVAVIGHETQQRLAHVVEGSMIRIGVPLVLATLAVFIAQSVAATRANPGTSPGSTARMVWQAEHGALGPIRDIAIVQTSGWAVGGQLVRIEGDSFTVVRRPLQMQDMRAVDVWSDGAAIAVGREVIGWHAGPDHEWRPEIVPGVVFLDVAALPDGSAWVVGELTPGGGVVGRWDSDEPWQMRLALASPAVAVDVAPDGSVLVVSATAALWRLRDGAWKEEIPADEDRTFYDLAVDGVGRVWAVGQPASDRGRGGVWLADAAAAEWKLEYAEDHTLTDIDAQGVEGWAVSGTGRVVVLGESGWREEGSIPTAWAVHCVSVSLDGATVLAGNFPGGVFDLRATGFPSLTPTELLNSVAVNDQGVGLAAPAPLVDTGAGWGAATWDWDWNYGALLSVAADGSGYVGGTSRGYVLRFDGQVWTSLGRPTEVAIYRVATTVDGSIWALGLAEELIGPDDPWRSVVVRLDQGGWAVLWDDRDPNDVSVAQIAALSADEAWIVGYGGAWHYQGGPGWSHELTDSLGAVAAVSSDEVWAAAQTEASFLRWDGSAWHPSFSSATQVWVRGMTVALDGTVWAAGYGGAVWRHSDSTGWRPVRDPAQGLDTSEGNAYRLNDIVVVGEGISQSAIVVGSGQTILRGTWIPGARLFLPAVRDP